MDTLDTGKSKNFPNSSSERVTKLFSIFEIRSKSLGGKGEKIVSKIEREVQVLSGSLELFSRYLPTIALFEYWALDLMLEEQKKHMTRKLRGIYGENEPISLIKHNPVINWSLITPEMMESCFEKFVRACEESGINRSDLAEVGITSYHVKDYVKILHGKNEVAGLKDCNYPLGCPCNKSDFNGYELLGRQEDHVGLSARKGQELQPMCGLHNRWKSSNPLFNLLSFHHKLFGKEKLS